MDDAFQRAIESRRPLWMVMLPVPAEVRAAPVSSAFSRLAARIVPDAQVFESEDGLVVWGRGEVEPPGATRLATRHTELVPEAQGAIKRYLLQGTAPSFGAPANWTSPTPARTATVDPPADTLLAMLQALSSAPPAAWIRRMPIVVARRGAKARIVARWLAPDPAVVARALGGTWQGATPDATTLRLVEPLMLAAAPRLLSGEEKLVVPHSPDAAFGGSYDSLDAAFGRAGIARIMPAISLADAVASPATFAAARARFAADGQRLLIACPSAETLGLLSSLAAPHDLVSIPADAAIAGERAAPGTIRALGPGRIMLVGCRLETEIAFGVHHGIGLFEGSVIEVLIRARGAA